MRVQSSVLASLPAVTSASPVHSPKFSWHNTKHLVAFGDSYTYVQGQLGYPNSTFIGSALDLSFTPSQLLTNQIIQNQTSTAEGGPNWVEYLTGCGLSAGLTLPQFCAIQLWDFAFGGADVSTAYTPLHHNWTVSLFNQTKQFIDYAQPVLKDFVDPTKTLVAVWIGINDIGDSDKYNVSFPILYDSIISTLFERVQAVHDAGNYRNWLFVNLPPLDRTPPNLVRAAGPLPNKTMIGWWDDTLAVHSESFRARNEGVKAIVFDANGFLNGVLDDHAAYGISNVTDYCPGYDQPDVLTDPGRYGCAPLEEYFWFNTGHMTSHTHEILAREMGRFLEAESS